MSQTKKFIPEDIKIGGIVSNFMVSVRRCARCGKDHNDLPFKKLEVPIESDGDIYTYWALCPNSMDPILLRIFDDLNSI